MVCQAYNQKQLAFFSVQIASWLNMARRGNFGLSGKGGGTMGSM